jgi:hypothetical protein
MFDDAAMAVRAFADAAETFQVETLPRYVRAWDRAQSEARSANDKADRVLDEQVREASSLPDRGAGAQARAEARTINGVARGQVAYGQQAAMAAMTSQFADLKAELAHKARATGDAMAALTLVAVPDSVARDFIDHQSGGQSFGWCNVDGSTFPPDLGTDAALAGMTLVGRRHAIEDGREVAGALQGWREHGGQIDPAVLAMLQARQGDPDFASTLLQELGPGAVAALPGELSGAHLAPTLSNEEQMRGEYAWRTSAPALLSALGVVLAAGTSATGDAALPDTWTRGFLAAASKDSYAPVIALVWAAQRSRPGVQFGTGFLTGSMNAITDYVSADITVPNTKYSTNNLGRLAAALGAYASASSYIANPGRGAGDLPDGWLAVGDPLHTMFAALGRNPQASTQWLHQGLPPTADQAAAGQLMSGRVGFWLQKHPVFQGPDQFLWGADNGAALGTVLEAGMTSGGALARDGAQNTAFFFHQMGASHLAVPEGARAGVRAVFVHWVDALNWNTTKKIPNGAMLRVGDNPLTPGRDDTGQPNFNGRDVQWLLKGSFSTNEQVTGYSGLSLGHLRQDFNALAQGVHAKTIKTSQFGQAGGQLGLWQGVLTSQYNDILLTHALEKDERVRAQKMWASFVVDVLTAPIPGDKAFEGLNSTLAKMATTGVGAGQDATADSMLDTAFPQDANVKAALVKAGVVADAGYADGKALLVQWAMESGMIDKVLIDRQWGDHLPAGITAKKPYGYTVDPKAAGEAFREFVQEDGAAALSELGLNATYLEEFAIDPAAKYDESKYLG